MAEPSGITLWAGIMGGVTVMLGIFRFMLGIKNEVQEVRKQVSDHELRVASEYPTRMQMKEALDDTVIPIHHRLDDNAQVLGEIKKTLDRERDEELQRLRKMASDRRKD